MSRLARIVVVHYSATGNVYQLASALADGARSGLADVRLRRVQELAPRESIEKNARWQHHADVVAPTVAIAELADLEWAEGIAFGTPTRFGLPSAQLKQFLDQTGALWAAGALADKVVTAFTSASTGHGGLESTILAVLNTAYHWGSLVMPVGYTDPSITALGNPYGTSFVSRKGSEPGEVELSAAKAQGRRLANVVSALQQGRAFKAQA